jgi:hypothetical protein
MLSTTSRRKNPREGIIKDKSEMPTYDDIPHHDEILKDKYRTIYYPKILSIG